MRHGIALSEERFLGLSGAGEVGGRATLCLKPQTFMNASGRCVALALEDSPEIEFTRDLIVVYDDLDLPFGRLRLRPLGSAGGHRGVDSVIESLGSVNFPRLRFGVGRPKEAGEDVPDYVLAAFSETESAALDASVEGAVDALDLFLAEGIGPAMDRFNSAPSPPSSDEGPFDPGQA